LAGKATRRAVEALTRMKGGKDMAPAPNRQLSILKTIFRFKARFCMSGGHFNYAQYRVSDIADMINELIASNDDESLNEFGGRRGRGYEHETIEKFREAAKTLRLAAAMAQRVDWLVSGDDGEDSFHWRWAEEIGRALTND